MADAEEQARRERIIFRLFAKAAGLPTRSVESRPVPEPDILCQVNGEGPVAFELGEVVHAPLIEKTNQSHALNHRFTADYAALPEAARVRIESRLGGAPAVFVSFSTPPGAWSRTIPAILDILVDQAGQLVHGEKIPVWNIPTVEDVVLEMEVQRAGGGSAGLYTAEMTEMADQTLALLRKKFSRPYTTAVPIELVAYYISQPPSDRDGWLEVAAAFIAANLASSPFRRVWLFNHFTPSIPLVLPARLGPPSSSAGG